MRKRNYSILFFVILIFVMAIVLAPKEIVHYAKSYRLSGMPTQRQEIAAAILNDKFYVIGGIDKDRNATDIVEIYDPKSDKWAASKPLPKKLHHVGAAVYQDKIYVIGGYTTQNGNFVAVNDVYEFDGNTWTAKRHMPTARGALGAAAYNGKIYAIGGSNGSISLPIVEIYNPVKDEWTEASPMNFPRDHLAVIEANNRIYAIGGRISDAWPFKNLGKIEEYNPDEDKWKLLNEQIKARSGIAAAAINNRIYLFGGESPLNVYSDFEVYAPSEIKKLGRLNVRLMSRHGASAIGYKDNIYIIGGALKSGYGATNLTEIVDIKIN